MTGRAMGALLGSTAVAALAAGLLASCASAPDAPAPLHLTTTPAGPDTRLTLVSAPGFEINARHPPALELPGGPVLRFTTGRRTADSAYFAEPPSTHLSGRHERVHGTLRASLCRDGEQVCRSVSIEL